MDKESMEGIVYLIKSPYENETGNLDWLLKIGYSDAKNINARLKYYFRHNPGCVLLYTLPVPNKEYEARIQIMFSRYSSSVNEWFYWSNEIVDFFEKQDITSITTELPDDYIDWNLNNSKFGVEGLGLFWWIVNKCPEKLPEPVSEDPNNFSSWLLKQRSQFTTYSDVISWLWKLIEGIEQYDKIYNDLKNNQDIKSTLYEFYIKYYNKGQKCYFSKRVKEVIKCKKKFKLDNLFYDYLPTVVRTTLLNTSEEYLNKYSLSYSATLSLYNRIELNKKRADLIFSSLKEGESYTRGQINSLFKEVNDKLNLNTCSRSSLIFDFFTVERVCVKRKRGYKLIKKLEFL